MFYMILYMKGCSISYFNMWVRGYKPKIGWGVRIILQKSRGGGLPFFAKSMGQRSKDAKIKNNGGGCVTISVV